MDSTSSSQEPTGGFQDRPLVGGVAEEIWLSLRCRFVPLVGVPKGGLPRFFVFLAVFESWRIFSRPPLLARYSSRTSDAFPLVDTRVRYFE